MVAKWKHQPGIIFDGTTSRKSADGAETPNGGHPCDSQWKSTTAIGLAPEPTPGKRERAHQLHGGAISNSTWVGGKIDAASKKGSGTRRCHRRRQDQRNAGHRISLAVSRIHLHRQTCRQGSAATKPPTRNAALQVSLLPDGTKPGRDFSRRSHNHA